MRIKSFVGGHAVNVYAGCQYDPAARKYTGGTLVVTIPFSGRMLSARSKPGECVCMRYGAAVIPVLSKREFIEVDPIPGPEECEYCIVSNQYVSACRALGIDTSRLLTIGDAVTDGEGRVIGCVNLNLN